MTLETERLLLRPITPEDAPDIFAYSKEENVGPNAGWKPHESLAETAEIMRTVLIGQDGVFGIVLKESGHMVGSIGLIADPKRENPNTRMLGYALSQHCWGRGLMTEAVRALIRYGFDCLKLTLISAYCYPHNSRSRNVLRKCGFQYEGCLKQCELLYDGHILDNECYPIIK